MKHMWALLNPHEGLERGVGLRPTRPSDPFLPTLCAPLPALWAPRLRSLWALDDLPPHSHLRSLRSYPSGAIACSLVGSGERGVVQRWHVFDDAPARTGARSSAVGTLVAELDSLGRGSALWVTTGRPRLLLTGAGGSLVGEDGVVQRSWAWERHGREVPLEAPIVLTLTPKIGLEVRGRRHVLLRLAGRTEPLAIAVPPSSAGPRQRPNLADSASASASASAPLLPTLSSPLRVPGSGSVHHSTLAASAALGSTLSASASSSTLLTAPTRATDPAILPRPSASGRELKPLTAALLAASSPVRAPTRSPVAKKSAPVRTLATDSPSSVAEPSSLARLFSPTGIPLVPTRMDADGGPLAIARASAPLVVREAADAETIARSDALVSSVTRRKWEAAAAVGAEALGATERMRHEYGDEHGHGYGAAWRAGLSDGDGGGSSLLSATMRTTLLSSSTSSASLGGPRIRSALEASLSASSLSASSSPMRAASPLLLLRSRATWRSASPLVPSHCVARRSEEALSAAAWSWEESRALRRLDVAGAQSLTLPLLRVSEFFDALRSVPSDALVVACAVLPATSDSIAAARLMHRVQAANARLRRHDRESDGRAAGGAAGGADAIASDGSTRARSKIAPGLPPSSPLRLGGPMRASAASALADSAAVESDETGRLEHSLESALGGDTSLLLALIDCTETVRDPSKAWRRAQLRKARQLERAAEEQRRPGRVVSATPAVSATATAPDLTPAGPTTSAKPKAAAPPAAVPPAAVTVAADAKGGKSVVAVPSAAASSSSVGGALAAPASSETAVPSPIAHEPRTAQEFRQRFGFHAYPMWFFFFRRRLVFVGPRLAGDHPSPESLVEQVAQSLRAGRTGLFLPDDFRFSTGRLKTIATLREPDRHDHDGCPR